MAIKMRRYQTILNTPWIYYSPSLKVISMSWDWVTWTTMADRNLWASTVYHDWDTLSESNCWYFFQWGNNYWFPYSGSVSKTYNQTDASNYWPWNYYSSNLFFLVRNWQPSSSWESSWNRNLWWDLTNTFWARRWPCDSVGWSSFHVPSGGEWSQVIADLRTLLWHCTETDVATYLFLPKAWYRATSNGNVYVGFQYQTSSSEVSNNIVKEVYLRSSFWTLWVWSVNETQWYPIRPFYDWVIVPSDSGDWVILYRQS